MTSHDGRPYCWRAVFSGDASVGVPGSDRHAERTNASPSNPGGRRVSTQAGDGPVDFGSR